MRKVRDADLASHVGRKDSDADLSGDGMMSDQEASAERLQAVGLVTTTQRVEPYELPEPGAAGVSGTLYAIFPALPKMRPETLAEHWRDRPGAGLLA